MISDCGEFELSRTLEVVAGQPVQAQVQVSSSSDWAAVTVPPIGDIVRQQTVLVSGKATDAYMADRTIHLRQDLERAEETFRKLRPT